MSQKQAISQTPIDLTPEDEAQPQNVSGKAPAESGAGPRADGVQPDPGQGTPAGRAPSRRVQDAPGNTVQVSPGAGRQAGGAEARGKLGAPAYGGQRRHAVDRRADLRAATAAARSPFLIALITSAVWFVLGMGVSYAVFLKAFDGAGSTTELLANPAIIAVIATVAIPIALFWFLAILVWRAQELRLMSSAMTEVAVRLAEPDRMAEQSVASLGQTVRRQVAAMNDAISRAWPRWRA